MLCHREEHEARRKDRTHGHSHFVSFVAFVVIIALLEHSEQQYKGEPHGPNKNYYLLRLYLTLLLYRQRYCRLVETGIYHHR